MWLTKKEKHLSLKDLMKGTELNTYIQQGGIYPSLVAFIYELRYGRSDMFKTDPMTRIDIVDAIKVATSKCQGQLSCFVTKDSVDSLAKGLSETYNKKDVVLLLDMMYLLMRINFKNTRAASYACMYLQDYLLNEKSKLHAEMERFRIDVEKGFVFIKDGKYSDDDQLPYHDKHIPMMQASFMSYLCSEKGLKPQTANDYSRCLWRDTYSHIVMQKYGQCYVYGIEDCDGLVQMAEQFRNMSNHNRFTSAIKKYVEYQQCGYKTLSGQEIAQAIEQTPKHSVVENTTGFLQTMAMNDLFANSDYNQLTNTIRKLEQRVSVAEAERDQAIKNAENLKELLSASERALDSVRDIQEENKPVEHYKLVADIFSEIAQRYMECMKEKDASQRRDVKRNLNSIMEELKMHGDVSNELKRCINHFDDMRAPDIPKVIIKEYILEKNVEHEVKNVEAGGTGISVHKQKTV